MFTWGREQFKEHGASSAIKLIVRVGWSRTKIKLANKLLAPTRRCPGCGWTGRRFYDYIEVGYMVRNSACPQCDSHPRHRAFYVWLREIYQIRNWRRYGDDFADRLAESGLTVEAHLQALSAADCRLFGVTPERFFIWKQVTSPKREAAS